MKPEELKRLIDQGVPVKIIDVREADEFAAAEKIDGAENIPMGRVFIEASKGNLPKDSKIVTVCKSGMRCEIVARELRERGYDIEALEGGVEVFKRLSS